MSQPGLIRNLRDANRKPVDMPGVNGVTMAVMVGREDGAPHFSLRQFVLEPGGYVEYKYRLEGGRGMVYTWTASNWVRSEMHSEADGAPSGTAEFFEVADRTLFRHGSYVAPFPGIHGWYWLNEGTDTVTVRLHAAGFFSTSTEFREDEFPIERPITDTPEPGAYRPDL